MGCFRHSPPLSKQCQTSPCSLQLHHVHRIRNVCILVRTWSDTISSAEPEGMPDLARERERERGNLSNHRDQTDRLVCSCAISHSLLWSERLRRSRLKRAFIRSIERENERERTHKYANLLLRFPPKSGCCCRAFFSNPRSCSGPHEILLLSLRLWDGFIH
ncbi:hypothetical protein MPTK1_1g24590 [Marchantia polymorpha subsp. ruderalis]|uniref:Uncharacterized protein n=2 Tax=Marchantia polymorpha TaxID=3197 RepID=A0AAF6ATV9_MARPO|nr:hypothetical protein MARPO_0061s0063 [Marchantia polymorpha]PTQ36807.1 hypothetical protein MARPO_0061s0063 [Marchantia polymorpha]BBM99878.1 hypothetical protein Mp_1g24590 [Marchantia polymorpha subsp. ruderalis]BBM99879.1 hypothetical protein Mp_1g24590 [Marchantia polymorpha subsp. ruderalis]|eukprot:PTQ36806.1 hypothetical protein MARPO_0061s0063 [Marchantia polymorpha]